MKSYLQGFMAIQYSHLKRIPLECERRPAGAATLPCSGTLPSYGFSIAGGGSVLIAMHHLAQMTLATLVAALLGESRPRILPERLQYPSCSF